jgi:hypothetical protein
VHFNARSSTIVLMYSYSLLYYFYYFNVFLYFSLFLHLFNFRTLFSALAVCTNKFISGARNIGLRRGQLR